jgi:hypothetical protein
MKVTRRQLAAALASAPLAAQTADKLKLMPQGETAAEELKAASDRVRRNTETLSKAPVPRSTEPAFSFRA